MKSRIQTNLRRAERSHRPRNTLCQPSRSIPQKRDGSPTKTEGSLRAVPWTGISCLSNAVASRGSRRNSRQPNKSVLSTRYEREAPRAQEHPMPTPRAWRYGSSIAPGHRTERATTNCFRDKCPGKLEGLRSSHASPLAPPLAPPSALPAPTVQEKNPTLAKEWSGTVKWRNAPIARLEKKHPRRRYATLCSGPSPPAPSLPP